MRKKSQEYQVVENLVKEKISKESVVYSIHRKTRTKDSDRFFEAFVIKPSGRHPIDLTSYLFDLRTGEILYQFESWAAPVLGTAIPYVGLFDEYQQHLKMEEAEKH